MIRYLLFRQALDGGQRVVSPLNGYQYAEIDTLSTLDLNRIWWVEAIQSPQAL